MECCGNEIQTAYCPDCGRPIGGGPLNEIQAHINGLLNRAEVHQQRSLEWEKENPDKVDDYRHKMRSEARDRKIAKYKRWAKAIEDAIAISKKSGEQISTS